METRMKARSIRAVIALALSLTLMLSACANTATNSADSAGAADTKPVVLKFWKGGNDPLWHDYWVKMIQAYENSHPGITIEFADAPFGDGIDTKLNVAYASGDSPDIILYPCRPGPIRASASRWTAI